MVYSQQEVFSPTSKERAMTQASYNDIAEWYDQFLQARPVYTEVILPNLLALIGEVEGEVICDLACGQGWVARELARRGAQVTGLDLAPNLLALAQHYEEQEPLGIGYLQGDAELAEGLNDQRFTGCVCVLALITIPDLQATFQSVRRLLKPGEWLVFTGSSPHQGQSLREHCGPVAQPTRAGSRPAAHGRREARAFLVGSGRVRNGRISADLMRIDINQMALTHPFSHLVPCARLS